MIQSTIQSARKIVIKIGSNTLAKEDGTINLDFMKDFARQCSDLMKAGKQIVIVSSGAQVAGVSTLDRWSRKKDIHYRQALCAIGQVEGVIPIINENDSVTFDEIRIGDNDNLSALTAVLWNADLLVLFSDIDGVFTDNPKKNPDAQLIEQVANISELRSKIIIGETNSFGSGGMATKLEAAERTTSYGIPMILANGGKPHALEQLAQGMMKATLFEGQDV